MKKIVLFTAILMASFLFASAQDSTPLLRDSGWSIHFQFTGIVQSHPSFRSPYEGQNSTQPISERAFSVTSTLFLGRKLWKGASIYFNPELASGRGVSSTLGIAGFPNGETFRVGNPEPTVYIGRIFLRQQILLGKNKTTTDDDINQVKEESSDSRITISAGKFSMADFFDANSVSHDPRNDFFNWALMSNGAYDYAANTRGYTYGLVVEYIRPGWALRAGTSLLPVYANGPTLNFNYSKTNSETVELEKEYHLGKRKGTARLLAYYNVSKAPKYDDVTKAFLLGTDTTRDVIFGKNYGGKKFGLGLNIEQSLGDHINSFLRIGWNDGKTATWAFAEIDNTITAGIRFGGNGWKRSSDNIGIAVLSNGISSAHRNFLNHGGYGFMIGDGKLPNYRRESTAEVFYNCYLFSHIWLTPDYQLVLNPAYNGDRGPIHLFAARLHVEW